MSRQRAWRADNPDAVKVDRSTKWGNPFAYRSRMGGLVHHPPGKPDEWDYEGRVSAAGMRHDSWNADGTITPLEVRWATLEECVEMYRRTITNPTRGMHDAYPSNWGHLAHCTLDEIRAELGGKDLACWCDLNKPCHADVLLELANPETTGANS
jgi:hypothetical protein